ncbi:MAG: T9SS type A sorting domain-containing protein [Flavobacteriales bacterium]|nr:T9SS type A sorting domain-containing protein [Flavobacteriales bacterium]
MKSRNLSLQLLILVLTLLSIVQTTAQTLDATFSSPAAVQCAGSLFTLNASTSGYQSYNWTITGSNNFSNNLSGASVSLNLPISDIYNVSLTVTDGVTTETNTLSGFLTVKPTPIINPISDQIKCSGMYSDAVNFIGNIPNATYTWSRTNTDISASPLYTSGLGNIPAFLTNNPTITQVSSVFTVTPSFEGCIGSPINFTITVNPPPVSTISTTSVCVGGTVTTTPNTGGTWASTNAVAATITNSGIVSVGNSSTQQIATLGFTETTSGCFSDHLLTVNPRPTVSAPASFCVGSTAQLSPSTGGTWTSSNLTIASINANSGLATGVSPGNVTFIYVNAFTGCSNSTSVVTVNSSPAFSTSKTDPSTCNGTNGIINIIGLTPNTSYQYSYALPNISTGPITTTSNSTGQITISGLSAGIYTLSIIHTATGCPSASQTVTLVNPNPPNINDIPDQNLCGTSYSLSTITGTNLTGNQAYYTAPNGAGSVLSVGTAITTTSTIYMYNSTIGGCVDEESFTVTINPTPIVTAPASVCVGSTAQLSPSIGGTWVSNNLSVATITNDGLVTGLANGTANFTFTNSTTGCIATTSNLTVNPASTFDPIPNQIVCAGDLVSTITFSGSAQQYNWTNDNVSIGLVASGIGNIASFIATNPTASDIVSTVTVSATGCSNTSNSFTITVKPTPTISPTSDQTVCHNDFTQGVTFTSSNPNAIYEWQNNNSSIGLLQYGTGPIPSFQALNTTAIPQVATFIVVPTLNGCPGTADTFLITVNPASTIDPTPNQIVCTGDLVSAITFSGSAQQYNWTNDNVSIGLGASGTGNIASFIATNPTANDIISTVTVSATGCSNTSNSFTITVKPTPTVYPSPDLTRCHNDSTIAINFSGAINGVDYSWTNDNVTIGCAASGTGNIPAFQVQNASTATQVANFVVTPILNGCVGSTINFDITVLPLPIVNAGNDTTICLGESYTPIVTGSGLTFTWNNGVFYNTPFTPSSTNTYTVIGSNNICNNSDSVTVTVNPIPQLTISTFDGEDSLACDGTLSVTVVSGTAPYTYAWTNGSGNFTTPIIENLCSGIYNLTVIDVNGCLVSNSGVINDTLIPTLTGDTLIFTDNIYQDSTIIGSDTSAWIDNCTFDYNLVTGATIDSYVDSGDSTFVTWIISLSDGTSIPVVASYFLSPGTAGVYELTLQLTCSQKSGPKFLISTSRIYYEGSTIGIEDLSSSLVLLFPNPATSTISIVGATETFQYEIRDIQGKLVKQGATEKEIDIASLTTGTYLISISSDEKMKQLRFVKL